MGKMKKNRLLKLADFLDTLKPKQLSLDRWVADGTLTENGEFDCGTVACAVGWACTIPSFRRAGLSLDSYELYPVFVGNSGWSAVGKFFGLEFEESTYLFEQCAYDGKPTPKTVAKRIRKFVADGRVPQIIA